MSVIETVDIGFLPYAGHEDPGLPNRIWVCSQGSLGDASGGTNLIQVNLKAAAVSPGNIFSLEQVSFRANGAGVTAVRITTDGLEVFPPGDDIPEWVVATVNNDLGSETNIPLGDSHPRLWLGRGATALTAGTLAFRTANDDGEANFITVMGYMWTPLAINVPGGPRRPASGIFPN